MSLSGLPTLADVNVSGLCLCGCGGQTPIATWTDPRRPGCEKGFPRRFITGHNGRKVVTIDYRKVGTAAGPVRLHILRAERAPGKSLPPGAVVHHADGSKGDHAQLVICQDQAYHMLLHARMRLRTAGGNPNTDARCSRCRFVKPRSDFNRNSNGPFGVMAICRACQSIIGKQVFLQRKERRGAYWRKART